MRGGREHQEELAVGAVGVLRPGHAHHAAGEGFGGELGRQIGQAGAAGAPAVAVAARAAVFDIAGLGHEALDHAVEDHPVIGPGFGQRDHPLDVEGREVGAQRDADGAVGLAGHVDLEHRGAGGRLGLGGGREGQGQRGQAREEQALTHRRPP